MNVESDVQEPTSLAMLKLVTRLQTPFATRELIECLSKVLDGTPVACESRIVKGPDVMFKVSFSTIIMSSVLNFKSWKLNNDVLTSFCITSHIWSWHSISSSMENCVFSWCTCIPRSQKFDALVACGVVVFSPPRQQGAFFFHVDKTKRLWHDCSNFYNLGNKTWTICESISLSYFLSARNSKRHTSLLCHKVKRAKKSIKF